MFKKNLNQHLNLLYIQNFELFTFSKNLLFFQIKKKKIMCYK